jgi:hypothetical protein
MHDLISEQDVFMWARTGQGRGFVFDASKLGWQQACASAIEALMPDIRVLSFDRQRESKHRARITLRESDVSAMTSWLIKGRDDVFLYSERLAGRIQKDQWTYPEAFCATNGFVHIRIDDPSQKFRTDGSLEVIDRVRHLTSGETRSYPEYLALFNFLKKNIRKATTD